jgi:3-deoxy-D-manno-oct-2-ulosonic acid (Kdo) hydroxylase
MRGQNMATWVEIQDYIPPEGWKGEGKESSRRACELLEANQILYFPRPPFAFPEGNREFLISLRGSNSAVHKNISYRPGEDAMRGFDGPPPSQQRLHAILRDYSHNAVAVVRRLLAPYDGHFTLDYASFRPLEEEGRALPLHKRNDLLHVDAFPSRPTAGGRILRVFTNLHTTRPRVWTVGEGFRELAGRLAMDAGLAHYAEGGTSRSFTKLLRGLGAPLPQRSAYDRFMLHFHDYLKENAPYQKDCPKTRLEFPPSATWLVFTDGVPHAVLSGQFALEQTFIIERDGLVAPQMAPVAILESLCGRPLAAAH